MAGIWADNVGWYTAAQRSRIYQTAVENGAILVGPYGPGGGTGMRFSGDQDDEVACDLPMLGLTPSGATAILEIDRKWSALPTGSPARILAVTEGGAVQVAIYLNTDGTLAAYRGEGGGLTQLGSDSSYVAALDTRLRLQLKVVIDVSSGSVDLLVWGPGDLTAQTALALTGQDTLETASATWDGFIVGSGSPGNADWSHLVVKDGSGGVHDDLAAAPQNAGAARGIADGTHRDWTPSAGIQRFAMVDDPVSDEDVTFTHDADVDETDTFDMADVPDTSQPVDFAMLMLVARHGGGTEEIAHVARQGGVDYVGASLPLSATYSVLPKVYQTAPDATAWSAAVWATVEHGYTRSEPAT